MDDPRYLTSYVPIGGENRPFYSRRASSDDDVLRQVFQNQEYNLGPLRRRQEILDYTDGRRAAGLRPLIVDAGANIGAASIYFLHLFPDARIVAIEPVAENHALLARNVAGLDVQCLRAAVGSRRERRRTVDQGQGFWAFRTEIDTGGAGESVDTVTMDEIYAAHGEGFFPFIAKIDIEGGERDLFSAATDWVERTPIIIVELHDWMFPKSGTAAPFLRCVSALERDFVQLGENVVSVAYDLAGPA